MREKEKAMARIRQYWPPLKHQQEPILAMGSAKARQNRRKLEGVTDLLTNGRMDGWTDGWTDGQILL